MPKKQVGNTFLQRTPLPLLLPAGRVHSHSQEANQGSPRLYYEHPNGQLWLGDSLKWLVSLNPESVDLVFADPPYNIGKADWDDIKTLDDYVEWSMRWIEAASIALKPTGSLYICGYSEILSDLRRPASRFFSGCKWLVWFYKNKANLGTDWGRSHESIIHFRKSKKFCLNVDDIRTPYGRHTLKYPIHPQAASSQYGGNGGVNSHNHWTPHLAGAKPKDVFEIPVTSNGMKEKTPHPTQKPEELLRKLLLASSNSGDLVVDPFSGSGTTLVVAEQLGRRWCGCDCNKDYNEWAVARLENVVHRSVAGWIKFDTETAQRRESIR